MPRWYRPPWPRCPARCSPPPWSSVKRSSWRPTYPPCRPRRPATRARPRFRCRRRRPAGPCSQRRPALPCSLPAPVGHRPRPRPISFRSDSPASSWSLESPRIPFSPPEGHASARFGCTSVGTGRRRIARHPAGGRRGRARESQRGKTGRDRAASLGYRPTRPRSPMPERKYRCS